MSSLKSGDNRGGQGDNWYSALTDTKNGLYKTEIIHRRAPLPCFNHNRLLEPIDYIPTAKLKKTNIGNLP